jgi:26S proteasome regulatory subunit N9
VPHADFYQRKLWHQLTVAIEESLQVADFRTPDVLIPFYNEFLSGFAHKLNPLRLAHIAVSVSEQYKDPGDAGKGVLSTCSFLFP